MHVELESASLPRGSALMLVRLPGEQGVQCEAGRVWPRSGTSPGHLASVCVNLASRDAGGRSTPAARGLAERVPEQLPQQMQREPGVYLTAASVCRGAPRPCLCAACLASAWHLSCHPWLLLWVGHRSHLVRPWL